MLNYKNKCWNQLFNSLISIHKSNLFAAFHKKKHQGCKLNYSSERFKLNNKQFKYKISEELQKLSILIELIYIK